MPVRTVANEFVGAAANGKISCRTEKSPCTPKQAAMLRKLSAAMGSSSPQRDENRNEARTGWQRLQRLADDRAERAPRIGGFHREPGRWRRGQEIAALDRTVLGVRLAAGLA